MDCCLSLSRRHNCLTLLSSLLVLLASCVSSRCLGAEEGLRYPLLYLDLDGTVLNDSGRIVESTRGAIDAYRQCGGRVGIATGRILEQAKPSIDALVPGLPVVLFNGAVVFNPATGETTVLHSLPRQSARGLGGVLRELGSGVDVIVHYANRSTTPAGLDRRASISRNFGLTLTESDLSSLDTPPADYDSDPIIKVVVVCDSADRERIKSTLEKRVSSYERVVISSRVTVEILPAEANKANAIRFAIGARGYEMSQVVAFGDGGNDVEMLAQVGLGIAMAGCYPPSCEAADLIIGSNNSDAIAKCLYTIVIPFGCQGGGPR
jgi:Cof subfamily protein (haloacid dehalogenase superfamily)